MTQALWYAARGSGLVVLVVLTTTTVLGVLTTGRVAGPAWPRFVLAALHGNLALLGCVFLVVHIGSSVIDPYAGIGWLDAVAPFGSRYRPVWLGLGAVALDLLLAVMISSLLRPRIGYPVWRAVHWLAYLCWPVAVAHGLGIGTDTRSWPALAITGGCVSAVLLAAGYRLWLASPIRCRRFQPVPRP
jgi:predicted ferric reductase